MLSIRDVAIDPKSLGNKMILTDVLPVYEFINNRRGDKIVGYKYVVALPKHSFEKIAVKIAGDKLVEKPETYAEVNFENIEVFAYNSQGVIVIGARATDIKIINSKN